MKNFYRISTAVIAMTMLCSCSVFNDTEDLPLVPALSEREVVDYYKKSMEFDTIVTRNIDKDESTYEKRDVSGKKRDQLSSLTDKVQGVLGLSVYPDKNSDSTKYISEPVFNYIKCFIDDKKLTDGKKTAFSEALGYYFVDVDYKVGARSIGKFTDKINFLGIHGAFKRNIDGSDSIDTSYMTQAMYKLNKYYSSNKINNNIAFNKDALSLTASGDGIFVDKLPDDTVSTTTDADSSGEEQAVKVVATETTNNRKPVIDLRLLNRVAGASTQQAAYMPKLNVVYAIPGNEGIISGYGIYPSGDGGLRSFGFKRSEVEGNITLRYVFKDSIDDPKQIESVEVYPVNLEMSSGIEASEEPLVPEFVKTELSKIVERSDRAINNNDIQGLMNNRVYNDVGMAVLNGQKNNWVNTQKQISTIRRIIARDTANNKYVVEIETVKQESPKGESSYGNYIDTYYVCIEQHGTDFIITDSILMARDMVKEPQVRADNTITKRLVALNLAGDIPKESKVGITELMGSLYESSTYRVLNGPMEVKAGNGDKITIKRGMYDCFNADTALLSSSRKEYINSSIREKLIKHGVNSKSTYKGIVTEWLGGADNQAELMTEELINYNNRDEGYYMRVYYLVSRMADSWVIDEVNVVDSKTVTGDDLHNIQERIK